MCRGLSMATPRFVIIVITAFSVSVSRVETLIGATPGVGVGVAGETSWDYNDYRVFAETPTESPSPSRGSRGTNNNPATATLPALSHTTRHVHNQKIRRRVTRKALLPSHDNEMSLPLISLLAVALTPSNPWTSSTKRHRRQSSQQQQQTSLQHNSQPKDKDTSSLSPSYPVITSHNTNHDNQKPIHHHSHNQQEHLLLASLAAANKFIRPSRGRFTHGHFLPFHGTLSSQESTISSGGGGSGTDTQKLLIDAKFQSPSSSSLAAAVVNTIRCSCDTGDCASNSENACITSGVCYTQFLDRGDGSRKLIRGCISEATPLLCENKPPRVSGTRWPWPYLRCCNSDMCNSGGLTIPPTHLATLNSSIPEKENSHHHVGPHQISNENSITLEELHETTLANHERTPNLSGDKELSLGIISFFIGSAVYVVVLSALGFVKFFLWRRKQSREACYYRKDLGGGGEGEVDEDRGGEHNETCLSSPVNTEETIDYEPNQISISIPCHHYQFQQSHDHHDRSSSSCVSASVPTTAIRLTATASEMKSVGGCGTCTGPVSTKSTSTSCISTKSKSKSTSVSLTSPTSNSTSISTTIRSEIGEM